MQQAGRASRSSNTDSERGSRASASRERAAVTCQLEGCGVDLHKGYHQRYRVCEFHLKSNATVKDGKLQRFCQQCSRFHEVKAFDKERRSCRARLQQHNNRRRRGVPATLPDEKTEQGTPAGSVPEESAVEDKPEPAAAIPIKEETQPDASMVDDASCGSPSEPAAVSQRSHLPVRRSFTGGAELIGRVGGDHSSRPELSGNPLVASVVSRLVPPHKSAEEIQMSANQMLQTLGEISTYTAEISVVHLAFKLFGRKVASLPSDLQTHFLEVFPGVLQVAGQNVSSWANISVDIVQEAKLRAEAGALSLATIVAQLCRGSGKDFWSSGIWMVQLDHETAVVEHGKIVDSQNLIAKGTATEQILSLLPVTIPTAGEVTFEALIQKHNDGQTGDLDPTSFKAQLRFQNLFMPLSLDAVLGPLGTGTIVRLCLSDSLRVGTLRVELSKGMILGNTKALLATDNQQLAEEMHAACKTIDNVDQLTEEVGALISANAAFQGQQSSTGLVWAQSSRNLLQCIGVNILGLACDRGWPALAQMALDTLSGSGLTPVEIATHTPASQSLLPPLMHRAVASRSPTVVCLLLQWGRNVGYTWDLDQISSSGVTPTLLAKSLGGSNILTLFNDYLSDHDHGGQGPSRNFQELWDNPTAIPECFQGRVANKLRKIPSRTNSRGILKVMSRKDGPRRNMTWAPQGFKTQANVQASGAVLVPHNLAGFGMAETEAGNFPGNLFGSMSEWQMGLGENNGCRSFDQQSDHRQSFNSVTYDSTVGCQPSYGGHGDDYDSHINEEQMMNMFQSGSNNAFAQLQSKLLAGQLADSNCLNNSIKGMAQLQHSGSGGLPTINVPNMGMDMGMGFAQMTQLPRQTPLYVTTDDPGQPSDGIATQHNVNTTMDPLSGMF